MRHSNVKMNEAALRKIVTSPRRSAKINYYRRERLLCGMFPEE